VQAIDLLDESGSRVRIAAYTARKELNKRESPKIREYLQVLDTKDEALKDALFEEAVILKRREMDYK
jgi:ATP-dependent Clp protease ATP-binding subunit ClpC